VGVAGWKNWAWLLPIGVMLALPNVWTSSLALLAGSAALWVAERRDQYDAPAVVTQTPAV